MEMEKSKELLNEGHSSAIESEEIPNVAFQPDLATPIKNKREPRKVLHFSDGTMEQYSSDEDENDSENLTNKVVPVDTSMLPWNQWFLYQGRKGGHSLVAACDYLGEGLANAFGITSQKYFYEVEEYKRCMEEEESERREEEEQMAGWNSGSKVEITNIDTTKEKILTETPKIQLSEPDSEPGRF